MNFDGTPPAQNHPAIASICIWGVHPIYTPPRLPAHAGFFHFRSLNCVHGNTLYNLIVIALLQGVPIFAGLDEKALGVLLEHTKAQEYPENEVIVDEGENCHTPFVIGSGSVGLFKNFGKPEQIELGIFVARH